MEEYLLSEETRTTLTIHTFLSANDEGGIQLRQDSIIDGLIIKSDYITITHGAALLLRDILTEMYADIPIKEAMTA